MKCPICGAKRVPVKPGSHKQCLGHWDQRERKCTDCGCIFYTQEEITSGQILKPTVDAK